MGPAGLVLVGAFVLLGATTQRITGMGFALVASPLLVLALGVPLGVQLTQVLSLVASASIVVQVWRQIEVKKAVLLFLPALLGVIPGAWISRTLPSPVLAILVGSMVLIALTATVMSERARVFKGRAGLVSAGFLSGFMNVTAGVGGPAVVLYALSTRWAHHSFVATVQLYFAALNVASLTAMGWPTLDGATWSVALGCLFVGLWIGTLLNKRVSAVLARRLVVTVAFAGSAATVIKGVLALS